ncbi:hypothetical protein JZ751_011192 [Albula glossodonta]|uniref:Uncharacterized protein n=1 Tax=Albula glossodonta TaxID=121402 RepID=A0A8T2P4I4_9TELE|nr:hypothetical protein JZ751_011192 [Albula glossodonta]
MHCMLGRERECAGVLVPLGGRLPLPLSLHSSFLHRASTSYTPCLSFPGFRSIAYFCLLLPHLLLHLPISRPGLSLKIKHKPKAIHKTSWLYHHMSADHPIPTQQSLHLPSLKSSCCEISNSGPPASIS